MFAARTVASPRLAALALLAAMSAPAAAEPRQFLIPGGDGYGVADCLAEGSDCGRAVADSWCESKGFGKAEAFGRAEATDITASVSTATKVAAATEETFIITCVE